MANLFDIGRSGLNSYRQSLAITGQNIANINTDGYKRRGAELEELSSAKASVLENSQGSGMGVRIGTIRRAFDEFLLNKARSATAYSSRALPLRLRHPRLRIFSCRAMPTSAMPLGVSLKVCKRSPAIPLTSLGALWPLNRPNWFRTILSKFTPYLRK